MWDEEKERTDTWMRRCGGREAVEPMETQIGGDGDIGGRAHSRPEVLQCYCSGVTMRGESMSHTQTPPSPLLSLSFSLPPSPPTTPTPRLQCWCSRVTSILTHSQRVSNLLLLYRWKRATEETIAALIIVLWWHTLSLWLLEPHS